MHRSPNDYIQYNHIDILAVFDAGLGTARTSWATLNGQPCLAVPQMPATSCLAVTRERKSLEFSKLGIL